MSDKPALRPGLAVGEALCAVARDILAEARAAISDPARSDAEAVHQFRRGMKRWRALLRLLDPFLGKEGRLFRTQARDLARRLGGARDAQSALDALADLADHGLGLSDRSLATMRRRIAEIKQAAETTSLTADMRMQIMNALDAATVSIERWPLDGLTFSEVAARLARGYRAARQIIPENWSHASPEELHELRKRIVVHRYQMETVQALWRRFAKMWLGEAQRLRDRLGKHQDLILLESLAAPQRPLAQWRSRLAPAIKRRQEQHVAAARQIAARLFVEKPRAFRRRLEVMWETGD